ncbi:hypothetical protein ACMFMG_004636 [Clarireedia jacksonii]
MARKKTTPIDVRQYKSITSLPAAFFRGIVETVDVDRDRDHVVRAKHEPPLLTFDSNETIRQIQAVPAHEEYKDCFEFKCNWISQSIALGAQGVSPKDTTGLYALRQQPPKLTPRQRTGITKRHGTRMRKYNQTSTPLKASSQRKETEIRPKQIELPPLDQLILELAKPMASATSAGRTNVLEYWQECRKEAAHGELENVDGQRCEETDSEGSSQQTSESDVAQYGPPARQPRPKVAVPAFTQSNGIAHRNCRSCYVRHYKCDRTLPACSLCATSNLACVYLDVSPSSKSSSNGD